MKSEAYLIGYDLSYSEITEQVALCNVSAA